jgi:hypothetical protein
MEKIIFLATIVATCNISAMHVEPVFIETHNSRISAAKEKEILKYYLPESLIADLLAVEKYFPNCFIHMFHSGKYAAKGNPRAMIFITDEQSKLSFAVITDSDKKPSIIGLNNTGTIYSDLFDWHMKQFIDSKNRKYNDGYYLEFNS